MFDLYSIKFYQTQRETEKECIIKTVKFYSINHKGHVNNKFMPEINRIPLEVFVLLLLSANLLAIQFWNSIENVNKLKAKCSSLE